MKVSFDFDGTLSIKGVQDYARSLVDAGHEVWIVTARYDSVDKYSKEFIRKYGIKDVIKEHNYLFEVAAYLEIPMERIVFTEMELKSKYFAKSPDFLWHLDDDWTECMHINNAKNIIAIRYGVDRWKEKCNRLLYQQ